MSGFRISLGSASCRNLDARSERERKACEKVLEHLEALKQLSVAQLNSLPEEKTEAVNASGEMLSITVYRKNLAESEMLLVVQAFMPTWWFPTYFSAKGVGKLFVDGFVVHDGAVREAIDSELWAYR